MLLFAALVTISVLVVARKYSCLRAVLVLLTMLRWLDYRVIVVVRTIVVVGAFGTLRIRRALATRTARRAVHVYAERLSNVVAKPRNDFVCN